MLSIIMLFLKGALGNFFGTLFEGLKVVFSDWRILAVIAFCGASWFGYHKFSEISTELETAKVKVQTEQTNNATLRGNVSQLQTANEINGQVINQLKTDNETNVVTITKLADGVAKTNKSLNGLASKIDSLKTPPTPLTPYLIEAIDGIQAERKQLQLELSGTLSTSSAIVTAPKDEK